MGHGDYVLVGTTDTDFEGDCDQVSANLADTAYLFDVIKESLPGIQLSESDVAYSFAGLRALVTSIGARRPSMVPREEMILESRSGLITIAGGKLTTHREIAERVVDRLMKLLGRRAGKSPTLTTPLPGARGLGSCVAELEGVPPRMKNILGLRYGSRTALIDRIIRERPELAGLVAFDAPAIAAEVVHAVRNECACHLSDFMVGRTSMVWRAPRAASNSAVAVAGLMGSELGWDRAREQDELDTFFSQNALRAVDGSLCRRRVASSRKSI
jgi:glycerol-3-phosphate dehydrogenase